MIDGDKLPTRHDCDSWRNVAALVIIIAGMIAADQILWPTFAKRALYKAKSSEVRQAGKPYVQGELSVEDEVAIAERLLPPELACLPGNTKTSVFISLNPDTVHGKRTWREPPQALLDTLNDPTKQSIKARSCAGMIERDSAIVDAETGKPGTVYYIHLKRTLDEKRFLVDMVSYSDGLSSRTSEYIATRTEAGWTFTATGTMSIS